MGDVSAMRRNRKGFKFVALMLMLVRGSSYSVGPVA